MSSKNLIDLALDKKELLILMMQDIIVTERGIQEEIEGIIKQ